ncbi:CobW family GTP-binding protein [Marinobacter zhejiangensis]|uniref:GTPase, G3E family n=1 Tax=Marinobacter zhejiangensis TaxID=488535 RepID=A0A1I4QS54_9GAMM|nr:GTP-binding protein [Marinobacter zhejiangensis]SFM42536.1 GTPase, G3E family [Marinobacter zhejiangensis]
MKTPIPTNLILGFLGVGKTTAILDLLKRKPETETWAVLVNEFGAVGVDGAVLAERGAVVREVPGGCMCCVAGLPMQIGLNRLIHQAKPDRLLIEPTGLGHPAQIISTLTDQHYADVLRLESVITLVDPRRLEDSRVLEHPQFLDQVSVADVLVANKLDLCSAKELERFLGWAEGVSPDKRMIAATSQGQLQPEWLEGAHRGENTGVSSSHHLGHNHGWAEDADGSVGDVGADGWRALCHEGLGHFSMGWLIGRNFVFEEVDLLAYARDSQFRRFKAVVRTVGGWRVINAVDGICSSEETAPRQESRLEVISEAPLREDVLDSQLRQILR